MNTAMLHKQSCQTDTLIQACHIPMFSDVEGTLLASLTFPFAPDQHAEACASCLMHVVLMHMEYAALVKFRHKSI